ncbi:Nucleoporin nup84 [Coemansia biformis]|uniref:Nuclear pore complex protein n=1 Tax=Coemansia biformis TaxID=1286918 RepID=A0A9W7Y9M3_9FUNG|nr:Nucleoporin nup84 [Coemansia biformis]
MAASDIAAGFAAVVESPEWRARPERADAGAGASATSQARAFGQLARQRCKELENGGAFGPGSQRREREAAYWAAESSTWDLLERLYTLRQQAQSEEPAPVAAKATASATATDFTSVQELMDNSSQLAEYVEVRRWLEATAPTFQPVETRKGYLFYTRRGIRERGLSAAGATAPGRTTTEADPDATSRQRKELAPEDAEYEAGLLRTLYDYVRRGSVGNAMDLCIESDEPWRAASLKGGLFWRDPQLEPECGMPVDVANGQGVVDVRPPHTAGNINRALWKRACAALAHDESNDAHERALYAALSGRLDEVVLVCETWEDYVWAYVNAMIEARIDQGIRDAAGLYVPASTASFDHIQSKYPLISDMRHVFTAMATHDSPTLRLESNEPFHQLQKALITDSFADYLAEFASTLHAGAGTEAGGEGGLLRLVVHAALCLQGLGFELPADAVHGVLEAYIARLAESRRELVAVYVAHMPAGAQTDAYARFLQGVADAAPTRLQLLQLAGRHGLDQTAIAKRTADRVLHGYADGSEDDCQMDTEADNEPVLAEPAEAITDAELDQIRAIEWVTSDPPLYEHALVQTCRLARQFLLVGRTNAATRLFNSLPEDFVQQDWVNKAHGVAASDSDAASTTAAGDGLRGGLSARAELDGSHRTPPGYGSSSSDTTSHFHEYMHLLSLCDALAYYSTWAETLCKQPVEAPSQGARLQGQWLEWREGLSLATDRAVLMFRDRLLEVDWLSPQSLLLESEPDEADVATRQRASELSRLRAIYIPEAVFRLHSILFDARRALPQNLQRSLDLAQLVADESLGIYTQLAKATAAHPQGRLPRFLDLMRQSAFEILRAQQEAQPDGLPLLADADAATSRVR